MTYISTDPVFKGIGLSVGIIAGVSGILSFGHQLYFTSSQVLAEEQIKHLLEQINTKNSRNLKVEN